MSGTGMSTSSTTTSDDTTTEAESGSSGSSGSGSSESGSGSGSGTAGALDFQINFMGYAPHDGQDIFVKVFADDDTEIDEVTGQASDAFSLEIPGIITDGNTYNVRWWVDFTEDGTCDPQPDDHMWEQLGLTADGTGLIIDHPHDADWTDVCPFWR